MMRGFEELTHAPVCSKFSSCSGTQTNPRGASPALGRLTKALVAKVRVKKRWLAVLTVASTWACVVSLPATLQAQRAFDVQRFDPVADHYGFLTLQGTRTPGNWRTTLSLWTQYQRVPLRLERQGADLLVIEDRLTTHLTAQAGIGNRLAVGAYLPLALQGGDTRPLDGRSLQSVVLLDPRLMAKYRILGSDAASLRDRNEGPGIALQGTIFLPIGSTSDFGGETKARTDLQALADFRLLGGGIGGALGWRHRFENLTYANQRLRDEIYLKIAAEIPFDVDSGFSGLVEFRGATDPQHPFSNNVPNIAEVDIGSRVLLGDGDISLTNLVGTSFNQDVGSAVVRAGLGIAWVPQVHDADGDGIANERDQCRELPEDFDGYEDSDGCLDPDNDNDLIPDEDDKCRDAAAVEGQDEDEDGCTDPVQPAPASPAPSDTLENPPAENDVNG